eukprot:6177467-Pleurochrysis_carterae.AAC.4
MCHLPFFKLTYFQIVTNYRILLVEDYTPMHAKYTRILVLTCRLAAFAMAPVRLPTAAEVAAKKRQRERTTLNVPSINTAASSAVNTQSIRAPAPASFGSNVPNNNSSAAARTPAVAPTQAGATSAARTCSIPQLPACGTSLNNCPQPLPPAAATASVSPAAPVNPNALIVSSRQRGNPVLKAIRNVQWQFGETSADYLVPDTACALFLSLRYHLLHPNYLICRLREMQHHNLLRMVCGLCSTAMRTLMDLSSMELARRDAFAAFPSTLSACALCDISQPPSRARLLRQRSRLRRRASPDLTSFLHLLLCCSLLTTSSTPPSSALVAPPAFLSVSTSAPSCAPHPTHPRPTPLLSSRTQRGPASSPFAVPFQAPLYSYLPFSPRRCSCSSTQTMPRDPCST